MARLPRLLFLVVLGIAAMACGGHDPYRPGESIGVFRVTGKLVSTGCGKTPDPWAFDVRLRHDKTTLFWVQGDAPISGVVDATARVVMKSSSVTALRPANEKTKTAACSVARADTVDLVLAPAENHSIDLKSATSFKGQLSYRFEPTQGSSCEDQLSESGGDFAALPCDVHYELAGERTGDAR